jgi:hypothetical protein
MGLRASLSTFAEMTVSCLEGGCLALPEHRPFATQARSFLVEDYQLSLLDVWAGFKSYSTPLSVVRSTFWGSDN